MGSIGGGSEGDIAED